MVDQDGEVAHQHTFSEEPDQPSQLLLSHIGFDRYENEIDAWRLDAAVRVRDTNVDYRNVGGRVTVVPRGRWENYKDSYL